MGPLHKRAVVTVEGMNHTTAGNQISCSNVRDRGTLEVLPGVLVVLDQKQPLNDRRQHFVGSGDQIDHAQNLFLDASHHGHQGKARIIM
jgi:hypothetical protein